MGRWRILRSAPAGLVAAAFSVAAAAETPVDVAIVLAVDASASVDGSERVVQRGGYVQALRHADFARAVAAGYTGRVAIAYFEWAGDIHAQSHLAWRVLESPADAEAMARAIEALPDRSDYGTSISRALDFALAQFDEDPPDSRRRVIDISGDGPNNLGPPVEAARARVVEAGVTINGLPVLVRPSGTFPQIDRYYEACVIGGPGAFILPADAPEELAAAIRRKLIIEMSGELPPPRVTRIAETEVDCLVGERAWRELAYPGLYE